MSDPENQSPIRVVVTGVGVVSSLGVGKNAFWSGLLAGRSGCRSLEDRPWLRPSEFRSHIGAPVHGFSPEDAGVTERQAALLDPVCQYVLSAGGEALRDAGLELQKGDGHRSAGRLAGVDPTRVATLVGTGVGGLPSTVASHGQYLRLARRKGLKRYGLPMLIPNAPPAQLAIHSGAKGECKAVATACASGTMAVGDGLRLIRSGGADMVLCGGAEATLSDEDGYGFMGFDLLQVMSRRNDDPSRASRPFDGGRDGFVLSEGAAILVLEQRETALRRGARVYAELAGYGATCDAYHIVKPEPDGIQVERMFRDTLASGNAHPSDIDYINAHGTSTQLNDAMETRIIRHVFGGHADKLKISATKSMTGHAIGASGAMEAVATCLTMSEGWIHPTINQEIPDPECDLDYVPNQAIRCPVRMALSTSYGFGGHNAGLLFRRHEA